MKKLISEQSVLINVTTVVTVLSAVFWFSWSTSEHFAQTKSNTIMVEECHAKIDGCMDLAERISVAETEIKHLREMKEDIKDLHEFIIGK